MSPHSEQAAAPRRGAKTTTGERVCPHFHAAVELIGRRWAGAIIYALQQGPLRFADLKHAVPGMSDRLLSTRLKELEQEGLVERTVQGGSPVRVSYALTAKGASLGPVIGRLREWARRNISPADAGG